MKNNPFTLFICILILSFELAYSQSPVPTELNHIVTMPLEDAQNFLEKKGYEIAASSLFNKHQLWWNETEKVCIKVNFNKGKEHKIESVTPGEVASCISGVEAGRKVWEKYHDGPAPANGSGIDKERQKLTSKGYVVSYWIDDVAPGRSTEYWKNASGECMHIVWNTLDMSDVSVSSCDAKYSQNPAPKK